MPTPSHVENRLYYQRVDSQRDCSSRVLVVLAEDKLDEDSMEFFDQEYCDVRWHRFEPEEGDREEVKRLIAKQGAGKRELSCRSASPRNSRRAAGSAYATKETRKRTHFKGCLLARARAKNQLVPLSSERV